MHRHATFPALESGPAYYYLGKHLLTLDEKNRLETLWGKGWTDNTQYVERYEYDSSFQTGLIDVVNILATIQNDRQLNERDQKLINRIWQHKLTYSKGRDFTYVEQGLVWKLVQDARDLYNKEFSDKVKIEGLYDEFCRIYGLPHKSIMSKVQAQEVYVSQVTEPKERYDLKFHYKGRASFESAYKCYGVLPSKDLDISLRWERSSSKRSFMGELRKTYPYVGKLYFSTLGEKYWQIYVYDRADSDRALQNVVHFMKNYKGKFGNVVELD